MVRTDLVESHDEGGVDVFVFHNQCLASPSPSTGTSIVVLLLLLLLLLRLRRRRGSENLCGETEFLRESCKEIRAAVVCFVPISIQSVPYIKQG
jgi:MYXO-CTERM domain-containing protein